MKWITFGTETGDDVGFGRPAGFSSTPSPHAWASAPGFHTGRPQIGDAPAPAAPAPNPGEDLVKLVTLGATSKPITMTDAMVPLVLVLALGIGAAAMGGRPISDTKVED